MPLADAPFCSPPHGAGVYKIVVRASLDRGATWGAPVDVAVPDLVRVCCYVDGGPFFDADTGTWHYIMQSLAVNGTGGWSLSYASRADASPLGPWTLSPANPVVRGGQLFAGLCGRAGQHCGRGTVDEGTPQIVTKRARDGAFIVTFHGYDYGANRAVRGAAATRDFVHWQTGAAAGLADDVIFSSADCNGRAALLLRTAACSTSLLLRSVRLLVGRLPAAIDTPVRVCAGSASAPWDIDWAPGGCVGGGAASVLRDARTAEW